MMSESKELLEATIKGLEEKCTQMSKDLDAKREELKDFNKPTLSQSQLDVIIDAVDHTCNEQRFDVDDYDFEFGIEYDGRLYVSDMNTKTNSGNLAENIVNAIQYSFKITDIYKLNEDS